MAVFNKLYKITRSSSVHRTESFSMMGHTQLVALVMVMVMVNVILLSQLSRSL